jgi:anti-anti-sigma factor
MQITISDFDDAIKRVTLIGKFDIAGAETVSVPLAALADTRSNILVDMSGVDFIASIGIHHLVMAAKTVARGGGLLVLLGPTPMVADVLAISGLEQILPVVRSEAEVPAAFAGPASA